MADFTLQGLRDEIVNDPQAIGYKEVDGITWKGDQVIADLLNDPANGATITRKLVQPEEITHGIVRSEWTALAASDREYLSLLLNGVQTPVDANESAVFDALTTIFPGGSQTRANLVAKLQRQGSRAEVLWGESVRVTAGSVGRAANL